jgi:hypothetical protein
MTWCSLTAWTSLPIHTLGLIGQYHTRLVRGVTEHNLEGIFFNWVAGFEES